MWKDIPGYEGLYGINENGEVRRYQRGKKFTPEQITTAKSMFDAGAQLKDVAKFLSTSTTTAFSIKHGKTWKGDAKFRNVKTKIGSDFYVYFTPCKDGKYRHRPIHRCLWEAFMGKIPDRMEINHKNLDRQDNRLCNLEIVTHAENCRHAQTIYKAEQAGNKPPGPGSYRGRYFMHNQ